jgi:hypothetical protein
VSRQWYSACVTYGEHFIPYEDLLSQCAKTHDVPPLGCCSPSDGRCVLRVTSKSEP